MKNKRQGYYEIKVADKVIVGHFSINFWDLLEKKHSLPSLEETISFMGKGINLGKTRDLCYLSTQAYALGKGTEPLFANEYECGDFMDEHFTAEHYTEIIEAFMESKVLGNQLNMGIDRQGGDVKPKKP